MTQSRYFCRHPRKETTAPAAQMRQGEKAYYIEREPGTRKNRGIGTTGIRIEKKNAQTRTRPVHSISAAAIHNVLQRLPVQIFLEIPRGQIRQSRRYARIERPPGHVGREDHILTFP